MPTSPRRFFACRTAALCCAAALTGCSWYGYGDNRSDSMAQELVEQARHSAATGDLRDAAQTFKRASEVDRDDVTSRWELARLQRGAGNYRAAAAALAEVVELTPDDAAAWQELGDLHFQLGNYVVASQCFEEALTRDPISIPAMLKQAELEQLRGYDEKALELYHRILSIDEDHVPAMLSVARIQMRKEQTFRAALMLRSVCYCREATPEQLAEARHRLGIAYGQQERWEKAVESLEIASKIEGDLTPDGLYYLAYAQYRAGQTLEARQTATALLQRSPDYEPAALLRERLSGSDGLLPSDVRQVAYRSRRDPPAPPGWPEPPGVAEIRFP